MSVADLIAETLRRVRAGFYAERVREYKRDERALTKAIARYGYECDRRGWTLSAPEIEAELAELLLEVRKRQADIKYLPVYLEGAVDRHIRCRAEELSARAKRIAPKVSRVISGVQAVVIREPTVVEVLSTVYCDLRSRRPRKTIKPCQQSLL